MNLTSWSWLILAIYVGLMVLCGYIGSRRVAGADDFAVARKSYGPHWYLRWHSHQLRRAARRFPAFQVFPTAMGSQSSGWRSCIRLVSMSVCGCTSAPLPATGIVSVLDQFQSNLATRYQSEALRVSAAIFSLMLLFYLRVNLSPD